MDIQHFVVMAQMAMQHGDYPTALHHLSMGLSQLPPQFSQYAAPLLAQRAECFWQLGNFQASVKDMTDAIRVGLPRDGLNSEVSFLIPVIPVSVSFLIGSSRNQRLSANNSQNHRARISNSCYKRCKFV